MIQRYGGLIALAAAIICSCIVLFILQFQTQLLISFNNQPVTPMPMFNFGGSAGYVEELARQAIATENIDFIADVCREGVIYGYGALVMAACNRAIELDPNNAYYHDYRGIARMVAQDFVGAESDLQVIVTWLQQNNLYATQDGVQRDEWIADIQAGRDPLADCRHIDIPQFVDCDGLFRNVVAVS